MELMSISRLVLHKCGNRGAHLLSEVSSSTVANMGSVKWLLVVMKGYAIVYEPGLDLCLGIVSLYTLLLQCWPQ